MSKDTGVTERDNLVENTDVRRKVNYYKTNVDAKTNKNNTAVPKKGQQR